MPIISPHILAYRASLESFLKEDWGAGDWTTGAVPDRAMQARVIAKSELVIAGLSVAEEVFRLTDPALIISVLVNDGEKLTAGTEVMRVQGSCSSILMAERVMLNLLQRLSGTATLTRSFVDAVAGTKARILDTRKTTPGLKILEKYAVRCGGGFNHRMNLADGILIKENHIAAAGGIASAVASARLSSPNLLRIEVEVETLDQLSECLAISDIDGVLLDNMDEKTMESAVAMRNSSGRRFFLEASGNLTLARAKSVALTGVDFLSVGALTHSAPAADLSLRLDCGNS
ncbi:MAG: carboxylating nicotinate-nucleotide diphosphorylase [Holophagales bacterium]|jgi:nicotinate-nucleotide pyrophosphorylase (carboxylating)|nr:carboxylating nicotinate-nucleotide diphosphorylase [Holophagales bacterium]